MMNALTREKTRIKTIQKEARRTLDEIYMRSPFRYYYYIWLIYLWIESAAL